MEMDDATFHRHSGDWWNLPCVERSQGHCMPKAGKPADDSSSNRPISLLSTTYKMMEHMILNWIRPAVDTNLPKDQAGFQPQRSCCNQVLATTTNTKAGFQWKLKSDTASIGQSAAHDTVWKDGLLPKLDKAIPCVQILWLLSSQRTRIFLGGQSSKPLTLDNGLPQGSVLTSTLFSVYMSDTSQTIAQKFA